MAASAPLVTFSWCWLVKATVSGSLRVPTPSAVESKNCALCDLVHTLWFVPDVGAAALIHAVETTVDVDDLAGHRTVAL